MQPHYRARTALAIALLSFLAHGKVHATAALPAELDTFTTRYAYEFFQSHQEANSDPDGKILGKYLTDHGLVAGKPKTQEVIDRVKAMQQALADVGAATVATAFWDDCKEILKIPANSAKTPAAPKATVSDAEVATYLKVKQAIAGSTDAAPAGSASGAAAPAPAGGSATGGTTDIAGGASPTATGNATVSSAEISYMAANIAANAKDQSAANDDIHAFFVSGVRTLSPYTITPDTATHLGKLDSAAPTVNAYLEFVYSDIWAWRQSRVGMTKNKESKGPDADLGPAWVNPFNYERGDFLVRMGYDFGQKSTTTASTIVGSGDFSASITLDEPFYRGWTIDSAYSAGLALTYAGVSDRAAFRVHNEWMLGPTISVGFLDAIGDTKRHALLRIQSGVTRMDSVLMATSTGAFPASRVQLDSDNNPLYRKVYIGGLEVSLFYPINKQSFLTFGGSFYGHPRPGVDLWNLNLGVTVLATKLPDIFSK